MIVKGLAAGADDYLTQSLSIPGELNARIGSRAAHHLLAAGHRGEKICCCRKPHATDSLTGLPNRRAIEGMGSERQIRGRQAAWLSVVGRGWPTSIPLRM